MPDDVRRTIEVRPKGLKEPLELHEVLAIGGAHELALPAGEGWVLASNAFAAYGDRLPAGPARIDALPTAQALLRLAPALLAAHRAVPADQALPLYIRDKVAQTTAEREAQRATAGA